MTPGVGERVKTVAGETLDAAWGRAHRHDPIAPRTGGPAGNARLTAWTGLLLLALFLAELITLLNVRQLISWHIAIGVLLIPPALLKTGSTSWRIVRYYAGNDSYRQAGPPPALLRILGPLVIGSTMAVLGSGVALVWVGEQSSRQVLVRAFGQRIDAITVHQASFIVWAVATGLHVLGRAAPAVQTVLSRGQRPGRSARLVTLAAVVLVAVGAALVVVHSAGDWRSDRSRFDVAPGHSAPR